MTTDERCFARIRCNELSAWSARPSASSSSLWYLRTRCMFAIVNDSCKVVRLCVLRLVFVSKDTALKYYAIRFAQKPKFQVYWYVSPSYFISTYFIYFTGFFNNLKLQLPSTDDGKDKKLCSHLILFNPWTLSIRSSPQHCTFSSLNQKKEL